MLKKVWLIIVFSFVSVLVHAQISSLPLAPFDTSKIEFLPVTEDMENNYGTFSKSMEPLAYQISAWDKIKWGALTAESSRKVLGITFLSGGLISAISGLFIQDSYYTHGLPTLMLATGLSLSGIGLIPLLTVDPLEKIDNKIKNGIYTPIQGMEEYAKLIKKQRMTTGIISIFLGAASLTTGLLLGSGDPYFSAVTYIYSGIFIGLGIGVIAIPSASENFIVQFKLNMGN